MSLLQGLIDSHCHLQDPKFDGEHEAVVRRAREGGVSGIVVVGYDLESSRCAVELAGSFEKNVYATVGVHPHDAKTLSPAHLDALARLAEEPRVVAIGEIGLDFYRNLSPPDRQRQAFREQLDLARTSRLPAVVHARDADDETFEILSAFAESTLEWPAHGPLGVMHCFAGDLALALRYIEIGFLISIAGTVTYLNAEPTRAVARGIPLDSIVIETDAPYLTPQSRRGQRNEPAYIVETARFIAELRSEPFDVIADSAAANTDRLFAFGRVPQPTGERL